MQCVDAQQVRACKQHMSVGWCWLLQVVAGWLKQYLPFKLLSDSSVALLAEVGARREPAAGCRACHLVVEMQLKQKQQQLQQMSERHTESLAQLLHLFVWWYAKSSTMQHAMDRYTLRLHAVVLAGCCSGLRLLKHHTVRLAALWLIAAQTHCCCCCAVFPGR
jgi:hypothetical protein